ncbi:hypothetical protein [Nostoc sp.]|uniref:hypothetical protein n=1 Tax=Nostoc sp. TaxID=1180 RepID=UPI002FF8F65C
MLVFEAPPQDSRQSRFLVAFPAGGWKRGFITLVGWASCHWCQLKLEIAYLVGFHARPEINFRANSLSLLQ